MHEVNNSHHTRYSRSSSNMRISPKQKTNSDKSPPCRYVKRSRDKSYLNDGDPTGFGSLYKCKPGHYSIKEYGAPQGHAESTQQTATTKINSNALKKKTTQSLSLTGLIARPSIPGATTTSATWKLNFARNVTNVARNDYCQRSMSMLTI